MTAPVVDVIIAVHSRTRPIARAVASVVEHTHAPTRVNVVAHNIDPAIIHANLGNYASHPTVRLLPFRDEIPSPAGPMNHGLDHASAPFTTLLGSDDEFAPGAIDSWLTLQRQTGASVIMPRLAIVNRATATLPPIRRGIRARRVSASRDRLSYRSAPLGLVQRSFHGGVRFVEKIASGEDIPVSTQLWFTAPAIAIDVAGPAYLVHEDATDRVTNQMRPVFDDFAYLDAIEDATWFNELRRTARIAIVSKLLRIQFLSAIAARCESIESSRDALRTVFRRLTAMAPGALSLLSRVDRTIIDTALSPDADPNRIHALSHERWNSRSLGVLLTRNPLRSLNRQAMFRLLRDAARVPME